MKAYKGFNKDMTCRGFQYEEGKEYETDSAKLCSEGFHACENPLDCFGYYGPGEAVYHEVDIEDNGERNEDDSKVVGKKIKIGAKLSVAQICKIHFEYVKKHTKKSKSAGNGSSLSAQDRSSLSAGNWSSLSAGKNSVLACFNSRCKADLNSVIVIANRELIGNELKITDFKAAIVDGEKIKANTWYKLDNGEFVED